MTGTPVEKFGLTIDEVVEASPFGKTKVYELISSGQLRAHKAGRRTFVLPDDLRDCIASLPLIVPTAND